MKKKKKVAKKKPLRLKAIHLGDAGEIKVAPLPSRRGKLMFSLYSLQKGGEVIELHSLPFDPYSFGHSVFKIIEGAASVYADLMRPMTPNDTFATIFESLIEHAERRLKIIAAEARLEAMNPDTEDLAGQGKVH